MKSPVLIGLFCLLLLFSAGCAQNSATSDTTPINQPPTPEGAIPKAMLVSQTSTPNAASTEITMEDGFGNIMENDMHVNASHTIRDIVNHPAFGGFGQFILPLDRGRYDNDMPLENVASLLPYHSNVDPEAAVNTINDMIDLAASGETIFYDFYTDRQKQSDPTKESTGLFFFRGEPGAPFAVISPGGGFSYVGSVHEGFPHAIALSQKGYNAFVLQYRVGG